MSGLRRRPDVDPAVLAAIQQAVDRVAAQRAPARSAPAAWRFSGRWFSAHPIRTRQRPGS